MRLGLRWFPVVTAVVFGVTATANVLQFFVHGMLAHLERSPAALHGEWWRTVTSLFVQDGGVAGTVSNLLFLLLAGVIAEQVATRPSWLVAYFGAGLAGEAAGYGWQPYGGGNSVAICGLAGLIAVALWAGDRRAPALAPMILLLWCGALLSNLWYPLIAVGFVATGLARIAAERGLPVGRLAAAAALLTGLAMAAAEDIHGAALLAGLAIAVILARAGRAARR